MRDLTARPRYRDWLAPFNEAAKECLRPGVVVLDVGGGRRPAIPRAALPDGARYIGLDPSRQELEAAPPGSYDEMIVADVADHVPALVGSVDLVVSWQVLEHVAPMAEAIANVKSYLRPGGRFVAQLSGGRALFALVNRVVPHRLAVLSMRYLLGRDPATVFPAPYDRCTHTELQRLLAGWSRARIIPRYAGGHYFMFLPPLQHVYLRLEDMMVSGKHVDIATHYLIVAER